MALPPEKGLEMSKRIVSAALAATAAAVVGVSASAADKNYTLTDLNELNDGLLGRSDIRGEYDLDADGKVDGFDMVLMRQSISGQTRERMEYVYDAVEENVNLIGRNLYSDGVTWLVQSGSAVEFNVSAFSAGVTLNGDSGIRNGAEYAPRYAVLLDDEVIFDDVLTEKTRTIELFSGTEIRNAKVKVIHLSEANNGAIGVSQIRVDSTSMFPVLPTPEKDLHIEFIGDSITCAYGVEGADQNENFKTTTENFMKSYAYIAAQKLNAEYSAVCYSGYGIISGYTTGAKNEGSLMPDCYEYIGRMINYKVPWDFSSVKNDVVVINLGTNDSSYIDQDFDSRSPEFTVKYEEFLETVREKNPDAYIICTVGTMGAENEYPLIEEAVENFRKKTGDQRVSCYWSVTHTQADGFGSDWHPNEGTQRRSAYVLADKICQALGMESDQIGLDVAAEAVYEMKCDEKAGANAASYFSDYNRSFWMNTVTGGSEPDDIEAVISPIGLKKNGEYDLSFKIKAPDGMKIPVLVRSKDGSRTYFSGITTGTGEDSFFTRKFTCDTDDASAEIAVQIGGKDYSNVTLSELRMEKIG